MGSIPVYDSLIPIGLSVLIFLHLQSMSYIHRGWGGQSSDVGDEEGSDRW
jgi:hypothetical protein